MIGRTISHYEIRQKLGAGGMGEVYWAIDSRLNRAVAIKALPVESESPHRRRRFLQEARAASALNHPNIITIYDIVSDDGRDYIVMEYVEGQGLDTIIPLTGLELIKALDFGVQIAAALQAAHETGIVHRDLKPANVMITKAGLVKVLDFGLAKLPDTPSGEAKATTLTVEGAILGTANYMSPEQAQGKKVDARSDIFSYGLVLYEMVTGQRGFGGDSTLSTLAAILRDDVRPIRDVAPTAPPELESIIGRALRKNPDERWQTIAEVRQALNLLKQASDPDFNLLIEARTQTQSRIAAATAPQLAPTLTSAPTMTGFSNPPSTPAPPIPAPTAPMTPVPATAAAKKPGVALIAGVAAAAVLVLSVGGVFWWKARHKPAPPPPVVQQPVAVAQPPAAPPVEPAPPSNLMTNDDVIKLVQGKVAPAIIINQMKASSPKFDFSTDGLMKLSQAGVSPTLIEAMRDPAKANVPNVTPSQPKQKQVEAPPITSQPAVSPVALPPAQPENPLSTTPAPPVPTLPKPVPRVLAIRDGTPLLVTLVDDIPQNVEAGAPLRFLADSDFKIGDAVLIQSGAPVTGEIVEAEKKRVAVIPGHKATYRIKDVAAVDGSHIKLRLTETADPAPKPLDPKDQKPPKGTLAGRGTRFKVYVDGEQKITVK